jgi:tetratricopeptide (TPR) repeat protein
LGDEAESCRSALAQIPWSIVLDFDDHSDKDRLLSTLRGPISQRRGFHLVIAGQTPAVTFSRAVCWMMADGWRERPDSIKRTLPEWRRSIVPAVRDLAQKLKLESAPKPVKIVILGERIEAPKLRAVCTALEEALPSARVVVVTNGESDSTYEYISAEVSQLSRFRCSYSDLAMGLHRMFGEVPEEGEAYIPMRELKGGASTRLKIESSRLALFSESFELVYDGASRERPATEEVSDFFRGNTITWRELDIGLDVPRLVGGSLQEQILTRIAKSRSAAIALEHTPGAGGTTVIRRIAWSLRNTYPTIVLNRYIETTPELIEWLGQASNLPVLIVIEHRDLSDAERDSLFRKLKGRTVRFLFLDVRRALKPRDDGVTMFSLRDPMSAPEADQFLDRYSKLIPNTRQKALKLLTNDRAHLDFRSAFFYGFYAFEEEFIRVPQFVAAHLSALTPSQRDIVARLALISRYSQSRLPYACLPMLADTVIPESVDVDALLGSSKRLIVFDTASLGVVHPTIAEEMLAQILSGSSKKSNWRANLADFCVDFIVAVGKSPEAYGDNINDILSQLFVERSIWEDPTQPRLFSNLIETIPTKEGQRRVLETLCGTFPSNAHFWNHLGRHLNLRIRAPYAESERCFLRAIEYEPNNEIHHHALGMVYRFEVRGQLERPLDRSQQLAERLEALGALFDKAEQCFRKAHELDSESQYPLVTHIQIIIESIERAFNLSGEKTYRDLLSRLDGVGTWCRSKLQRAETLLEDLKQAQAESEHSKYTLEFESKLFGLYGNFDAMVRGMTELLKREDVNKRATRRLIAYCHLRQNKEDFDRIDKGTARRIVEMMLENLAENPGSGSDMRLWLRAFRMLPEFTLSEALERVGTWAVLSDNIDAYYYLYILHYVHLTRGAHASLLEVRKNIEICRRSATPLVSKRSFEWWSSQGLARPCPLVHHSELIGWDRNADYWSNSQKLGYVEGIIDEIRSPQAGSILINGLPAFFVPARLLSSTDVNTKVKFHLGFSYEGLRAWNVQRI